MPKRIRPENLKHEPLALVDENMPVIAIVPNNQLFEKLKSNLQEVKARVGQLIVFADAQAEFHVTPEVQVYDVAEVDK